MSFHGREKPLFVYGPPWVEDFMKLVIALGYAKLRFEVFAIPLSPGDNVIKHGYSVRTARADHSVPSLAYALVEDLRPGRFNRDRAIELGVPEGPLFSELQSGNPVEIGGKTVYPEDVVGDPRTGRKIVYSGDTRPAAEIIELGRGADLLIHDGTLAEEKLDWARESLHSTAREAAEVAREAGVRRLILTHISSRYSEDPSVLLEEARNVFENTEIASDLLEVEIPFSDTCDRAD
jgi:ribonuclease Z